MENLETNKVELPSPTEFMASKLKGEKIQFDKNVSEALKLVKKTLSNNDIGISIYGKDVAIEVDRIIGEQGYALYENKYNDNYYFVVPVKYADALLKHIKYKYIKLSEVKPLGPKPKSLIDRFFDFVCKYIQL